jgi:hypothetical protein
MYTLLFPDMLDVDVDILICALMQGLPLELLLAALTATHSCASSRIHCIAPIVRVVPPNTKPHSQGYPPRRDKDVIQTLSPLSVQCALQYPKYSTPAMAAAVRWLSRSRKKMWILYSFNRAQS